MTMMKKGNVTILASILAIALVAAGVGAGTMAWFSTEKVSAGNTVFTAGIMAMESLDAGPFTTPTGWKPGDSFTVTFVLHNTGNIDIGYLATFFTIEPHTGWGITFADNIEVTEWWEYIPGTGWQDNFGAEQHIYDLVGNLATPLTLLETVQSYVAPEPQEAAGGIYDTLDQFGKYVKDDSDYITGSGYDITAGPAIIAGGTYKMEITFKFMESAGNDLQGRTLTLYTKFFGMQDLSQRP
jgi:hypothetical protein